VRVLAILFLLLSACASKPEYEAGCYDAIRIHADPQPTGPEGWKKLNDDAARWCSFLEKLHEEDKQIAFPKNR
jgi:hypothetical protein